MRILLTNDDGFHAPGLQVLAETLAKNHEICIAAPDQEQSAVGHAITIHRPLRVETMGDSGPYRNGWKITGTPTDCVKMALETLLEDEPDLIISGINNGSNLGTDILYSGTVAAAFEGWLYGYPALSVSLKKGSSCSFRHSSDLVQNFVTRLKEYGFLSEESFLNINFPENTGGSDPIKGFKITELGLRRYKNIFEERTDPQGRSYYWLGGDVVDLQAKENSDVRAVNEGWISVTPIKMELTNRDLLIKLRDIPLDDLLV